MAAENYRWSASPSAKDGEAHIFEQEDITYTVTRRWYSCTYLTDDSVLEFRVDTHITTYSMVVANSTRDLDRFRRRK